MAIKGVTVESIYKAHIRVREMYPREYDSSDMVDKANKIAMNVVKDFDNVRIDDEFRCNLLTEIGIIGDSFVEVTMAARWISDAVDAHPLLELFEMPEK